MLHKYLPPTKCVGIDHASVAERLAVRLTQPPLQTELVTCSPSCPLLRIRIGLYE